MSLATIKPGLRAVQQLRAVIYLRISLDRTGREAGVTRQREDCERRARDRDWVLVDMISDNDQSATRNRRKRPGFERLLTMIETGEVDVVIAWTTDRLQRSKRDELRLYEACREHGVVVSLVRGPDLDWSSPASRATADFLSTMARMEAEVISDRRKRANRQGALAGKRLSGRRPFGYEKDGITIREAEADALRAAYRSFIGGVSLASICRTLNDQGFTTGADGPWTTSTLAFVLANARYAGLRSYAPLPALGEAPLKGRPVYEVVGPAEWPGIVPEETWQAAVAKLRDPARQQTKKAGKQLLTSVGRCGRCGAPVWSGVTRSTRGPYRIYRCSATRHLTRKADDVDRYVSDVIVARLSRADAAELTQKTSRAPDVEALRERAQALRTQLDELASMFAAGTLTRTGVEAASERLRGDLAEVEGRLADAGRVSLLAPIVGAQDVRAAWEALTTDRKRVVIDTLAEVTLLPPKLGNGPFREDSVKIIWRTD